VSPNRPRFARRVFRPISPGARCTFNPTFLAQEKLFFDQKIFLTPNLNVKFPLKKMFLSNKKTPKNCPENFFFKQKIYFLIKLQFYRNMDKKILAPKKLVQI
jgi:hypothetical protein